MLEIQRRQLLVDGEPRLLVGGEVHYFRVPRDEWPDRVRSLKAAGCNLLASYIPWLLHELPDGSFDVTGRTRPERDVAAFIDLCRDEGLYFLARPGPFVMAELKNEGLPYSVYRDHPEIVPSGWDDVPAPTRTVDYLAPSFLAANRRWYEAIMPILAPRLQPNGGNVIGVQLDNEVGMLAWVTNSPDLTDHLLSDLRDWVRTTHGDETARRYPFDLADDATWARAVRSPDEQWAAALRVDLGRFMRTRFAHYVQALRADAEELGIRDVPFVVNIHGTEGGSGAPFPIGISQLVETYAGVPGMLSGSDHYMGDMTLGTTTDLHMINAFMAAVHDADQPITSVEFEAGSGDYGGGLDMQYDPSTVELKTRLCLAQGNRLINYYLFAGGINPPLDEPVGDGNDRISFTGERHGTAAPVGPEGQHGLTYAPTARVTQAAMIHERWLASTDEEHDDLALGFVLDHYLTEYHHPGSPLMTEIVEHLQAHRGAGARRALWRSLLLAGYRFGAVDLQSADVELPHVVALATTRYLDADVQQRLVDHASAGGSLLLLGPVPELDLEGRPCSLLADALGVKPGELVHGERDYWPTLVAHGWAAPWPQTTAGWLQPLQVTDGDVVLTDAHLDRPCGVDVRIGSGRAIVLAAELPSDPALFATAARELGVTPGVGLTADVPGVVATTSANADGERLLHLLNVSGYPAHVTVSTDPGADVSHELEVPARSGHWLALGLEVGGARLAWADAELTEVGAGRLSLGPGLSTRGDAVRAVLQSDRPVAVEGDSHQISTEGRQVVVTGDDSPLTLTFS
ncbi:beta-galactosidase [Angustibacter luteus]|uniref:Beta-galactosidase n=1 Tax=Angustibacter luteus TaxID=658456 RepID=A0ABW1JDL9_9ACTN